MSGSSQFTIHIVPRRSQGTQLAISNEHMKINADLSQRAVVYSEELPWVNSPAPGVQRRMLERDGEESGRATTIVRFAPNSSFPMHSHGGGEEYLVLSGVFSDEHGDRGPGTYIRNPVGSQHTPYSQEGCIIFVKLCQMSPEDQNYVCIDTNQAAWEPGPIAGLQIMPLHRFGTERVFLIEWEAGIHFPDHTHEDGSEVLVLEGVLEDEHGSYPKGTWLRHPVGSSQAAFSPSGCLLYAKGGHLLPDLK